MSEHEHDENENELELEHDHDHDDESSIEEAIEIETETQLRLEIRRQNIDLLKIAVDFAGYGGQHPPLKPHELQNAVKAVWDAYGEFEAFIDPFQNDEDEDEDGEDDDE